MGLNEISQTDTYPGGILRQNLSALVFKYPHFHPAGHLRFASETFSKRSFSLLIGR